MMNCCRYLIVLGVVSLGFACPNLSYGQTSALSPPASGPVATEGISQPPGQTTSILPQPPLEATTPTATPSAAAPMGDQLTRESIQQRIEAVAALPDLDDAAKAEVKEKYQQAIVQIDLEENARKSLETFKARIADAPARIEEAKKLRDQYKEVSKITPTFAEQIAQMTSVNELEKMQMEYELNLKQATDVLTKIQAEPKARVERQAVIQQDQIQNRAELERISQNTTPVAVDGVFGPLDIAKMTYDQVRKKALEVIQESLQYELDMFLATTELLPIKLDNATADKARLEKRVGLLRERVNLLRKEEADKQIAEKKKQAETVAPELAPLAKELTELAVVRKEIAVKIDNATDRLKIVEARLEGVTTAKSASDTKLTSGSMSTQTGQLLRRERENLPDITELRREIQNYETLVGDARFQSLDYSMQRQEFADLELVKDQWVQEQSTAINAPYELTEEMEAELEKLLLQQRDQLEDVRTDYNTYIDQLMKLKEKESALIEETREYSEFINERVLWIRSTYPLSRREIRPTPEAWMWIVSSANWNAVGQELKSDISNRLELWLAFGMIFLLLFVFQRPVRRWMIKQSEIASRRSAMEFVPTLEVVGYSLFLSMLLPTALMFVGWRLSASLSENTFALALSRTLIVAGQLVLIYEITRHFARRKGLVDSHLDWNFQRLPQIRRALLWSMFTNVLLWSIVIILNSQSQSELWSSSLGRLSFLVMAILNVGFTFSIFNLGANPQPVMFNIWVKPLKWLVVFSLCAVTILATIGYYETALVLTSRLFESVIWILAMAIINGILARALLVNRRRMAVEQARIRREAQSQSAETATVGGTPLGTRPAAEDLIDLSSVTNQTRKFIRTAVLLIGICGIWQIWNSVMPALNQTLVFPVASEFKFYYSDLIFLVFSLVITYLVATNLPGFIELAILGRLPLDKGARYAISTLSRYAVSLIGIIVVGSTIGLTWENIQWLVAALSVGLGFGLQEIFANFVSGLIILFERPIRVGDVVTLGSTTGLVSKIRIRSTTITDWDEKEYIVPNKDLITGSILNWTLSSTRNRVVVKVGVSYDSDPRKVKRLLEEICRDHGNILEEPAPLINFDGFGDSTLDFVIRFYLPSLENRLKTVDEVHNLILERFRLEGIEISFPQRDLHIRSWSPPVSINSAESPEGLSLTPPNGHTNGAPSKQAAPVDA